MVRDPIDETLRALYAPLAENHQVLKEQMMDAVNARTNVSVIPARPPRALAERRRVLWCLGTAAVVVAATVVGFDPLGRREARAYVLQDMPQRMAEVQSLHLKGWIYGEPASPEAEPARFPHEIYLARPTKVFHTWHGFSPGEVTSGSFSTDGQKYLQVADQQKVGVVGASERLAAELQVESLLQGGLVVQILHHRPEGYRPIRRETIGDVQTVVYEFLSSGDEIPGVRELVWLDPQTGLPVRAAAYFRDDQGNEIPSVIYEQISANVPPPQGLFDFNVPEGYTLMENGPPWSVAPQSEAGNGDLRFAMYPALNIGDRGALVCWSCQPSDEGGKSDEALAVPAFRFEASTQVLDCTVEELRVDETEAGSLHWWLLRPSDGRRLTMETLTATVTTESGSRLSHTGRPLRFPEPRGSEIVVEYQRSLLPEDADRSKVATLAELLQRLAASRP